MAGLEGVLLSEVELGVEPVLIPKISSSSSPSSSASSMKDGACAFFALGFTFWNRSLVACWSKIDTGAGPPAGDGSGAFLVMLGAGGALLLLTATEPNRSSSEEDSIGWASPLTSLESVSPGWVDTGSERTEGLVRDCVKDSWEGEAVRGTPREG